MPRAGQLSLDDLGTPLRDVTFCVVDLETTGGSPTTCGITEIGAVKLRGGECLGTFQTLVNPGRAIPPTITVLTGITEAMVLPAPRIEDVLPSLLEFVGDAVIVGHNVRFDLSFLQAALEADDRPRLTNRSVDTVALARRLVREEVPNCKLGTLADRFRLPHRPSHRALDDALATGDLLHLLLERAGRLGVTGLDDLLTLPTMAGHAQAAKLRLTEGLPRSPGVYLFRDARGDVLYVGKATDLRARVRSYFSGDERRKIGALLRETVRIDHVAHPHTLAAAVHEVRLIQRFSPRYNRQAREWGRYVYVKLTLNEAFPRLSIVKEARDDGAVYLGPLTSRRSAQLVVDAIHTASRLRRCTARVGRTPSRQAACASAQLGVTLCPCAGGLSAVDYQPVVDRVVRGLRHDPDLLLDPLRRRIEELAASERFEEAADARDRAAALAAALRRQRRLDSLRRSGFVRLHLADGSGADLEHGRLLRVWPPDAEPPLERPLDLLASTDTSAPLPRDRVDEALCVAAWLDRSADRVALSLCEGELASPLPSLPTFQPAKGAAPRRHREVAPVP
ncbi:DEDD exonuclease domain-containing protein [Rhabdothermincola salaria]|uniref:DEDD exonuclease domain-containing protein n=1 Tax=Rhabdothermincola salaria TaxID=2903142 RepID=UPI001E354165|nr:DEDD exonuclease domain-containing protein [Rhabdothermincola salaria]